MTALWIVELHDDFVAEYHDLAEEVQDKLLAHIGVLERLGPGLGRPRVDTLKGSRHANMKELRLNTAGGVWRFAFAFDPSRMALILCGGNKSGVGERRFYQRLVHTADARFDSYLRLIEHRKRRTKKDTQEEEG